MTGVLCRVEAFRDDCFAHYPAGVGLQRIVQPVITDSQCHYHLTHIQEMSGVPVGEMTNGQHLLFRTESVFLISRHTVSVRQVVDTLQRDARNRQQAFTLFDTFHRLFRKCPVAKFHDPLVNSGQRGILRNGFPDGFFSSRRQ